MVALWCDGVRALVRLVPASMAAPLCVSARARERSRELASMVAPLFVFAKARAHSAEQTTRFAAWIAVKRDRDIRSPRPRPLPKPSCGDRRRTDRAARRFAGASRPFCELAFHLSAFASRAQMRTAEDDDEES